LCICKWAQLGTSPGNGYYRFHLLRIEV
jgi:hypothetical protein